MLAVESYNIEPSPLSAGAIQQVLTGIDGRQATLFDRLADYGGRNVISADKTIVAAGSSTAVDVWDIDTNELLFRVDSQFADFDISADASVLAVKADRRPRRRSTCTTSPHGSRWARFRLWSASSSDCRRRVTDSRS